MLQKALLTLSLLGATSLFALTPLELSLKSDALQEGYIDSKAKMKMTLTNRSGRQSFREMKQTRLEGPKGDTSSGDKSLIIFIAPADVAGTALLTHEKLDKDDNQWLFLPSLKRVKRIASKNKSGSFMGSEFAFEDIASQDPTKFTYSDTIKTEIIDGKETYIYERYPKDKYSGYTKQVIYTSKDFLVQKVEYYDRKKKHLKTQTFRGYHQVKGIWRMGGIEMINHQNKKSSKLEFKDDHIQVGLSDKNFNKRVLKKAR
jgi:outer membrane lipoprotein-sorting protein